MLLTLIGLLFLLNQNSVRLQASHLYATLDPLLHLTIGQLLAVLVRLADVQL